MSIQEFFTTYKDAIIICFVLIIIISLKGIIDTLKNDKAERRNRNIKLYHKKKNEDYHNQEDYKYH